MSSMSILSSFPSQQVIFSQSSELLERQSSMASSMEEVSTQQDLSGDSKLDDSVTTDQQFGVFKDFDFLEYELESQEDEGMDQFNWGVHRHSLSSLNAEGEKENTTQVTPSHSSRKVQRDKVYLHSNRLKKPLFYNRITALRNHRTMIWVPCRRWMTWKRVWDTVSASSRA